jgi:hypothetical protein
VAPGSSDIASMGLYESVAVGRLCCGGDTVGEGLIADLLLPTAPFVPTIVYLRTRAGYTWADNGFSA